ncbi:hypothetical protein F4825DRAFT_72741 [Nemania diffusa]|nr:hypothetical protein F4825DRAFT_72741 [Nemania diffusa]
MMTIYDCPRLPWHASQPANGTKWHGVARLLVACCILLCTALPIDTGRSILPSRHVLITKYLGKGISPREFPSANDDILPELGGW